MGLVLFAVIEEHAASWIELQQQIEIRKVPGQYGAALFRRRQAEGQVPLPIHQL